MPTEIQENEPVANAVANHLQLAARPPMVRLRREDKAMTAPGEPDRKRQSPHRTRRIAISELLGEGREAVLLHDGAEYRLRLTSNGKLILTK